MRRKDNLHVACGNVLNFQDASLQAMTIRELRIYNVGIACLSEVRIPGDGLAVIKVPGEETCYHLYHGGVVDNTGRHGVTIALSEAT